MKKILRRRTKISGQGVVEYSLLIGIVIAVFITLTPMVKRGTQGMVKIVADEIGVQNAAEQRSEEGLVRQDIVTAIDQEKRRQEWRAGITHSVRTVYDDQVSTNVETESNLGTR